MGAPSQLSIATSALMRLVKEEGSYHKELEQQTARLAKIEEEEGDENKEYMIKQQRQAIEETNAIFPTLKKRIQEAEETLEALLEAAQKNESGRDAEEKTKAQEALTQAKKTNR